MATYVPGSQTYAREIEPFTPDYKFLSNVLETRQDRYDTNYKQLSDLYGRVVYADLSRDDTKQIRDQYAQQLTPKIQQISGLDLSLRQNVESARGLFKPFYEDDLIVKDLVYTKEFKKNVQLAQVYKNSDNSEQRKKYWATGMQYLNYQLQDFKEADRDKALAQGLPTYVENVDLMAMSTQILKDAGFGDVEIDIPDPNGYWIIREKNGKQQVPGAYNFLQKTLLEDPRVIDAYRASGYVDSRNYAQKGLDSGQFSSVLEGQTAWARERIADLAQRNATANEIIQKQFNESLEAKENWENYQKTSGITPESDEAKAMAQALEEHDRNTGALQRNQETLEKIDAINLDEDEDLLNKAFNLLMNYNLSSDILGAAQAYSMRDYSRTLTANPYKLKEVQHRYDMAKINQQHLNRLAEIKYKAQVDPENAETAVANLVSQIFGDGLGQMTPFSTQYEEGVEDIVTRNAEDAAAFARETVSQQIDFITSVDQLSKEGRPVQGTQYGRMSITLSNGEEFTGTYDQVKTQLLKDENISAVDSAFGSAVQYYSDQLPTKNPNAIVKNGQANESFIAVDQMYNTIQGRLNASIGYEQMLNKVTADNWNLLVDGRYDQTLSKNLDGGIPQIMLKRGNGKDEMVRLSEEDYVNLYVERAKNKQISSKDYYEGQGYKEKDGSYKYTYATMLPEFVAEGFDEFMTWATSDLPRPLQYDGVIFNMVEAANDAREQYSIQNKALNNTFNEYYNTQAGGARIFQPFSADAFFRGVDLKDMTSSELFTYRSYEETFNVNTIGSDQDAAMMLKNAVTQYNMTPEQERQFYIGNDPTTMNDSEKVKDAAYIQSQIFRDMKNAMLNPKAAASKDLMFDISYNPMVTVDGKEYASYTFRSSHDYISNFAGATKGAGSGNPTQVLTGLEIPEFTSITMLFPQEQDLNPRKAGAYNFSSVDMSMKLSEDNAYNFNTYKDKAGSFKVFENNGAYMVAMDMMKFDPKTGNFVNVGTMSPEYIVDEEGVPVGKHNLDNYVNSYQLIMMEKFRKNLEEESAWKRENGIN